MNSLTIFTRYRGGVKDLYKNNKFIFLKGKEKARFLIIKVGISYEQNDSFYWGGTAGHAL